MKKTYNSNNKSYPDLKAELHRAKDKLSHLSNDLERLEEENAQLRESLANELPMYPEHYHEEKHTAFQLGKSQSNSVWFKRGLIWGAIVSLLALFICAYWFNIRLYKL